MKAWVGCGSVHGLEPSEQELTWSISRPVGSTEDDGEAMSFEQLDGGAADVARSIVQLDHRVLAPVGSLLVELQRQLPEEDVQNLGVGVGRNVKLAMELQVD